MPLQDITGSCLPSAWRALFAVTALGAVCVFTGATGAQADRASCENRTGALGVERVVEIDTADGPRFGNMQYKEIDFLKPGEVVLTFDDGPLRRYSLDVLNALERHCTKATFFMVGRMAVTDPVLVKEIDRRGHTVASHTWSHKNLGRQSAKSAKREIELGISAISAALGKPVAPFFRFPYLSDPKRMQAHLRKRGIGNFSIDIDAVDFRTRSGSVIVERIMRGLKRQGKGILLFHDIQKSTARGLGKLLDRLKRGGYKVVHIVPKAPVKTLAEYDDDGMKILMKRKARAGERPLAKRSIVWPVSLGNLPPTEELKIVPPVKTFVRKGRIAPIEAVIPQRRPIDITTKANAKAEVRKTPAKRAILRNSYAKRAEEEPRNTRDWRDDAFNNQ
ncbi:MAG: polysaccharide deacetylase family protein [Pseudomonadota bacterium]